MSQLGLFLVLIGVAAVVLAALGGAVAWFNEEDRRIRRGLKRVLKEEPHALVIAYGRGRGAGFNFTSSTMAVAWDGGGWCLIYRIEELVGVELVIDQQVAARAYRGEARRPLDVLGGAEKQVLLRLVFDDPNHPEFTLELWNAARPVRRGEFDAAEAVEEGNRWMARIESIFRRRPAPLATRAPSRPPPPSEPPAARPPPAPEVLDDLPLFSAAEADLDADAAEDETSEDRARR